jgi:hypothetical protein
MLALLAVAVLAQDDLLKKSSAFLEKHAEADDNPGHRALAALALGSGDVHDRIVAALAKDGPKAASYPRDFAMAYTALAVIEAHRRDPKKHADAAKAFVEFLRKQQNQEGDWAYDYKTGAGRWTETTMNVPLLEALLSAGDARLDVDPETVKRSAAWIAKQQVDDGRFRNDPSRPASTETTAAAVAALVRFDRDHAAVKKAGKTLVRVDDILAAMKDGKFKGLTEDDRKTWGPDSFPYALYYTALAERRLSGPVKDAKRKAAILEALATWQAEDGAFSSGRGRVYGTALVALAIKALFE